MGSFNTTCFASNQTIAPDDECVIVPIIQQAGYRPVEVRSGATSHSLYGITASTCHPDAFWSPVGGFVEGRYRDYGQFELSNTATNRLSVLGFIGWLRDTAATTQAGENECHDLPFDLAGFLAQEAPLLLQLLRPTTTGDESLVDSDAFFAQLVKAWDYIWDVASEHRLFAATDSGVLRPVQFSVMHKAACDGLISIVEARRSWDGHPLDRRSFFERALAQFDASDSAFDERLRKATEGAPDEHERLERVRIFFKVTKFSDALARMGSAAGMSMLGEQETFHQLLPAYAAGDLSAQDLFEALRPLLNRRYVLAGLDVLNLRFSPQVYADQDYSNEMGGLYADFVQATRIAIDRTLRERHGG